MTKLYTFLAVAVVLGISSCSSSKKTTQTQSTDDMYYSTGTGKGSGSDYVPASPNDQYVQMKAQDPDRWSYFDDYNAYDSYAYAAPAYGMGYGMGYYPSYGLGYSPFFGPSFGFGMGFGDPYLLWNNYFMWNSWYNPYFYNPYYGGGALVVSHSPTAIYSNLRPFNTTSYANGLAHNNVAGTTSARNALYRPGMTSTTAYNRNLSSNKSLNTGYRPANSNSFRSFNQPTRSYSPSFGGSGGFRGGSIGGRR
jgi:hypothetical protein